MATTLNQKMNIVIVGHVDHGKSTLIGRLLADTNSLPQGKLEQVRKDCELNSKPFEYAFLIDALKDEQAQGITIDAARVFFKSKKRNYIIIDAPGHIEFLKNMITGAARAEAALLVIDAKEGIQENSKRHGYLLSMLGISQIAVCVNKMDLINFDQTIFQNICKEYQKFLDSIGLHNVTFIPVSGIEGSNIALNTKTTPWYKGHDILTQLDSFQKEPTPVHMPLRMPVQDVYKFTKFNDDRRIVVGTIATGEVKIDDELTFYPSGKKGKVKTIETFSTPLKTSIQAGLATSFTLTEQIFIKRGELAVKTSELQPKVSNEIKVSIFWLGHKPLQSKKEYFIKIGASKHSVYLKEIIRVIDAADLGTTEVKTQIERHDVAECILSVSKPITFDIANDIPFTSRFVIIDQYEISGGGIIREAITTKQNNSNIKNILEEKYTWKTSQIKAKQRQLLLKQKSGLTMIVSQSHSQLASDLSKNVEEKLFLLNNLVYRIDLCSQNENLQIDELCEHIFTLIDAGILVIVSTPKLEANHMQLIKNTVIQDKLEIIKIEDGCENFDLLLPASESMDNLTQQIIEDLQEKRFIYSL